MMKNMPVLHKLSVIFFAICLAGMVALQAIYSAPLPVVMPVVPVWLGPPIVWAYLFNLWFVAAAACMVTGKMVKQVLLLMGLFFLISVLFFHTPAVLSLYPAHFGSWTNALKALAFSGGAFIISELFPQQQVQNRLYRWLDKISVAGPYFFGIMMVIFGYDHFIYQQFVSTLVPAWIPGAMFWTYFAGVALMAGGVGIICNIKLAGTLSGAMIFLWFIFLHIPRAVADPYGDNSNEWTSVFEALAFSGMAYLTGTRLKRDKSKLARQGITVTLSQGRAAGL
ncbi:MAG TPA: hypothetical protein VG738_24660 [Chitinophagaceae bacterium]|nr:hypothetical protein [Chitinophagaceae bacterium]